jgi:hypothetical protein
MSWSALACAKVTQPKEGHLATDIAQVFEVRLRVFVENTHHHGVVVCLHACTSAVNVCMQENGCHSPGRPH